MQGVQNVVSASTVQEQAETPQNLAPSANHFRTTQYYPSQAMLLATAWRGALAISILLATSTAAFPQDRDRARALPAGVVKHADVVYASIEGRDLSLDIYAPATTPESPIPVIVWVHGGGWRNGSKAGVGRSLPILSKGYGLVSVEYRLSGEALFPAAIADVKAAFRWVRANASTVSSSDDLRID